MKKLLTAFSGSRAVKYLLGLLVFLVVADGVITNMLITRDIARESNPFLWHIAGSHWLVLVKALGAGVCAVVLWDIYRHWPRLGFFSVCLFNLAYMVIVGWNCALFFI